MAKACVNISDVSRFSQAVNTQSNDIQSTITSLQSAVNAAIESVRSEIQKADTAIAQCTAKITVCQSKISTLQSLLNSLHAKLASTPPTITRTWEDENGETHSETIPNPEIAVLEAQIAGVQQELDAVQKELERLQGIKRQLEEQKAKLSEAQSKLGECLSELSACASEFTALSQEASTKLTNVIQVLHEYMGMRITPPSLAGKRGGGLGGGGASFSRAGGSAQYGSVREYCNAHNYGPEDYEKYSKDPVWRELMQKEFPDTPLPMQNIAQYLKAHNYGPEDYETYSQDPVWRELMQKEFPNTPLPEIEDEIVQTYKGVWVSKKKLDDAIEGLDYADVGYQEYIRLVVEGKIQRNLEWEKEQNELRDELQDHYDAVVSGNDWNRLGDLFTTTKGRKLVGGIFSKVAGVIERKFKESIGGSGALEDVLEDVPKPIAFFVKKVAEKNNFDDRLVGLKNLSEDLSCTESDFEKAAKIYGVLYGADALRKITNGLEDVFQSWVRYHETSGDRFMREHPIIRDENGNTVLLETYYNPFDNDEDD